VKTVRKTRSGNVEDSVQCYDNHSCRQSNLETSLTRGTRDRFSQTDFPENFQQEAVLGQYIETKLRPDFNDLKVSAGSDRENPHSASSEIVIVEFEQEEII